LSHNKIFILFKGEKKINVNGKHIQVKLLYAGRKCKMQENESRYNKKAYNEVPSRLPDGFKVTVH